MLRSLTSPHAFLRTVATSIVSLVVLLGAALLTGPAAQAQTPITTLENGEGELRMELNHNGSLLAPGTYITDGTENDSIPATGGGTRLMWYPEKAAFRAGRLFDARPRNADGRKFWDASNVGPYSVALGANTRAESEAAVALGRRAFASGDGAVAMGLSTTASGSYSTAMGTTGEASGRAATAMGAGTTADGNGSFAAGRYSDTNGYDGTFVWGDGSPESVSADTANQVVFQAGGGMKVYTESDVSNDTGAELPSGSGSWSSLSSKDAKTDIEAISPQDVLGRLNELDLATWRYEAQEESIRHMGPMAEDFYQAFGLGQDEERISTVDADGVALAAIQGLSNKVKTQKSRIAGLEEENKEQDQKIDQLEERLEALERGPSSSVPASMVGPWGLALLLGLGGLTTGLLWRRRQA